LKNTTTHNFPDRVILHCSATPDYPFDSDDFDRIRATHIRDWHLKRGFDDIGYHFVVTRSGIIETGRHPNRMGAHCKGHNKNSIGVCWVGTNNPTKTQVRELLNLYILINKSWAIDWTGWHGHDEFNPHKACPCISMDLLRQALQWYHRSAFLK